MTKIPDYTPEPMAPAIIVASLLTLTLCLIATGFAVWNRLSVDPMELRQQAHIESGLEFPPLIVDDDRLHESRQTFYRDADIELIIDEIDELRAIYHQVNDFQFPQHGTVDSLEVLATGQLLEEQVEAILPVLGPRGFEPVARPHFDACTDGLEDLSEAIRSGSIPFSQAAEDPPADRFQAYRHNCGRLLPTLYRHGLIDDEGHWAQPHSLQIVDVIQRYRWAALVRGSYPAYRLISPYEMEIFYRWRIEHDQSLTPAQRLDLLDEARPFLPDHYDYELTEVRLRAASTDDHDEILDRFLSLADDHPDHHYYHQVYETVRHQLRTRSR